MEKEDIKFSERGISRRKFLKGSAAAVAVAGLAAAFPGCQVPSATDQETEYPSATDQKTEYPSATDQEAELAATREQTFITTCRGNCNWGCSLKAHVRDGILHKVSANSFPDPNYTGICLRGLSHVQRTYSPNRVKYPMRRVGERGSDQWERITWDEAIKEISEKLCHFRDTYGSNSIVMDSQSGNVAQINGNGTVIGKLGNCIGATMAGNVYDRVSTHGMYRVMRCHDHGYGNETSALLDAKMIVIWGTNPVYSEPHVWRFMQMAHENGAKIVCFDPMKSATAHKADQYIPVVPGSDAIIALAMCNYIIENDLLDEEFVKNKSNAPFLVRRDNGEMYTDVPKGEEREEKDYYVYDPIARKVCLFPEANDVALEGSYTINGVEVDTAFTLLKNHLKQYTFAEASRISGVPEEVMEEFTKTYVTIGPVTINLMYSIDHYQNGHLFFHAAAVLQTLTGNIGRPGAGFTGVFITHNPFNSNEARTPINPMPTSTIPSFYLYNVWRDQEFRGQSYPLKALITTSSNSMSNYADQSRWFKDVFPNMEYWVVLEHEMTDCARHADIVLPAAFWFETFEIRTIYNTHYAAIGEKAIEPLYECKPDSEILSLIGNAMGYTEDFPLEFTHEDWARVLLDSDDLREHGITWETLHEKKLIQYIGGEDEHFVRGGKYSPITTYHGRLMIYWEDPAPRVDYGQELTPEMLRKERMPYFAPPKESWETNPLYEKYPLVFIQEHSRFRTHTQFFEVPLLKELDPEPVVKMGRECAESRGIKNGDIVEVYNDRGHVVVRAVIDDAMGPGLISIPKGWQRNQFISGGYQELTSAELDPMAVGGTWFDVLVNVRKWNE